MNRLRLALAAFGLVAAFHATAFVAEHNLSVTGGASTGNPRAGYDVPFVFQVSNGGPFGADNVVLTITITPAMPVVWAPSSCAIGAGTITCAIASPPGTQQVGAGVIATLPIALRPTGPGTITMSATVTAAPTDLNPSNDTYTFDLPVTGTAVGVPVPRYRLYSPVTREHLFTTSLAEYNALGALTGTWIPEGTSSQVLNNPGPYNGVDAVPYYRLYNRTNAQHHWTTDPNEYYTLTLFPQYTGEGIDGFILPTQAPGTIPLYRLMYPYAVPVLGLHHWTTDAAEYNALIATYGWVGEGGSGFVIP